jgi:hypothetical protein
MERIVEMIKAGGVYALWIAILGIIANLMMIAGFCWCAVKKSQKARLIFAVAGMMLVLLIMAIAVLGYSNLRELIQQALYGSGWTGRLALWAQGMEEASDVISLGFYFAALPFVGSIFLMAWGLFTPTTPMPLLNSNKLPAVVAALGFVVGVGLLLWASWDFVRFDDYFQVLMFLTR